MFELARAEGKRARVNVASPTDGQRQDARARSKASKLLTLKLFGWLQLNNRRAYAIDRVHRRWRPHGRRR